MKYLLAAALAGLLATPASADDLHRGEELVWRSQGPSLYLLGPRNDDPYDQIVCHEMITRMNGQYFYRRQVCPAPAEDMSISARYVIGWALSGDGIPARHLPSFEAREYMKGLERPEPIIEIDTGSE